MSGPKIARIINKRLEEAKINLDISKSTVNRYLKEALGKPRKVKRVFF